MDNLTEENFAERFRQEKLATNDDFNTAEQQALKTEAKKKIKNITNNWFQFILLAKFFGDDGFEIMFFYHTTLSIL